MRVMSTVYFIPPSQRRLAMLAAQADLAPVLVSGAAGTGKSAIARWIHANSPRAARPLVTAKHEKSLTEQIKQSQAGSLFIPEIGEWSLSEQKILLIFLKTKSVPAAQDTDVPMLLSVRIITTASQALEGRAQGGLFNTELLEKLNVFRIEMPSLAKRDEFEDIVAEVLAEMTRELHKEHIRTIGDEAMTALRNYDWPGNIRELRNVLRIAVLASMGDSINESDLPDFGHHRVDFRATREQFQKVYITELLKSNDWQIDETCRTTRMDKETLLAKIEQYGINQPTEVGPIS